MGTDKSLIQIFIWMREFLLFDIKHEVHSELRMDMRGFVVTFSFRVSVGIEVIIRIGHRSRRSST